MTLHDYRATGVQYPGHSFPYAMLYPMIALRVRGELKGIAIFSEHWYGRKVDPIYRSSQPRTGEQQGWRSVFYDGGHNWSNFDSATKNYYNEWAKHKPLYGYNRYLSLYLKAHYPMIIYWNTIERSAADPSTIPVYMSEAYHAGIQRIRAFSAYPASPPYGNIIYRTDFNKFFGFKKDSGWSEI